MNTINGQLFTKMFVSGNLMLEKYKEQVNALNVFPVPDGDTGSNMSATYQSAIQYVNDCKSSKISDLSEALAKGAQKGARGNSGVILSQILKGFTNITKQYDELNVKILSKALRNSVDVAYNVVSKPKEGTMLTVIRYIGEQSLIVSKKTEDIEEFFKILVEKGEEILAKTPDMLEPLKKAGVVDSGGFGVVTIFKGFLAGIRNEEIVVERAEQVPEKVEKDEDFIEADITSLADIKYAYCTEFFIINLNKKTTLSQIDMLRDRLNAIGDSVIVVGDLDLIKVHVHTNTPGVVLQNALKLGELDKIKIDNMLEENRAILAKRQAERKPMGMLSVCSGDGLAEVFKDLNVDGVIEGGQTMNPSANDIATAAKKIHAENIFILPNNKNIIMAAEQARTLISDKHLYVIPSKNIPQGMAAALAFDETLSVDDNIEHMLLALDTVQSGSVTYAVRDTSINGLDLKEGDIIGLNDKTILTKGNEVDDVVLDLVKKMSKNPYGTLTVFYGDSVTEDQAEILAEKLRSENPNMSIDCIYGGQPLYYYLFSLE